MMTADYNGEAQAICRDALAANGIRHNRN